MSTTATRSQQSLKSFTHSKKINNIHVNLKKKTSRNAIQWNKIFNLPQSWQSIHLCVTIWRDPYRSVANAAVLVLSLSRGQGQILHLVLFRSCTATDSLELMTRSGKLVWPLWSSMTGQTFFLAIAVSPWMKVFSRTGVGNPFWLKEPWNLHIFNCISVRAI